MNLSYKSVSKKNEFNKSFKKIINLTFFEFGSPTNPKLGDRPLFWPPVSPPHRSYFNKSNFLGLVLETLSSTHFHCLDSSVGYKIKDTTKARVKYSQAKSKTKQINYKPAPPARISKTFGYVTNENCNRSGISHSWYTGKYTNIS